MSSIKTKLCVFFLTISLKNKEMKLFLDGNMIVLQISEILKYKIYLYFKLNISFNAYL